MYSKTYDIFISHAWKYGDSYQRVINFLDETSYFKYRNYSAPKDKPLISSLLSVPDDDIKKKIYNKIRPVNCVLVISGMYVAHRDWIKAEIEIAKSLKKPLIAIKPRGAQKLPQDIRQVCCEIVGWNRESIVRAIKLHSL